MDKKEMRREIERLTKEGAALVAEGERLTKAVEERDGKIAHDATLIKRVREAEEKAEDYRRRLDTVQGRGRRADNKLKARCRELEVALEKATRPREKGDEDGAIGALRDRVRALRESRDALVANASAGRVALQSSFEERNKAVQRTLALEGDNRDLRRLLAEAKAKLERVAAKEKEKTRKEKE